MTQQYPQNPTLEVARAIRQRSHRRGFPQGCTEAEIVFATDLDPEVVTTSRKALCYAGLITGHTHGMNPTKWLWPSHFAFNTEAIISTLNKALVVRPSHAGNPGLMVAKTLHTIGQKLTAPDITRIAALELETVNKALLQLVVLGLVYVGPRTPDTPDDQVRFHWGDTDFDEATIREALGDAPPVTTIPDEPLVVDVLPPLPETDVLVKALKNLGGIYRYDPTVFTTELVKVCQWLRKVVGEEDEPTDE